MQDFSWQEYPLSRPLVAFITGILLYNYGNYIIVGTGYVLVICCMLIGWLTIKNASSVFLSSLKGMTLLLTFVWTAMLLTQQHSGFESKEHISHLDLRKDHFIQAKIQNAPSTKSLRSYTLEAQSLYSQTYKKPIHGLFKVHFPNTELAPKYKKGDIILIQTQLSAIKKNSNPYTFDYAQYLKERRIIRQGFVKEGQHQLIKNGKPSNLEKLATHCRLTALEILNNKISNKEVRGVIQAMLLGDKDDLNPEIQASYVDAGVVHILAVSGLHVGILTTLLFLILHVLPNKNVAIKVFKTIAVIAFVSFYTLVAGGAPSLIRASVMCSIVLLSHYLQEDRNLLNSLFFAALVMLTYNPGFLFHLGFQFSFLALFSIVYFQDRLLFIWRPSNKFADQVYQLFLLSLSAQILLFPLNIYYFKQVPTLFMISGILAIPMAYLILYFGVAILVTAISGLDRLCDLLSVLISTLIQYFHHYTLWIQDLPLSTIEDCFIKKDMMLLSYAALVLFMLYLSLRKKTFLYTSLLTILLMLMVYISRKMEQHKQVIVTVYDLPRHYALDFFHGTDTFSLMEPSLEFKKIQYNVLPNRQAKSSTRSITQLDTLEYSDPFLIYKNNFLFMSNKIFFITPKWFDPPLPVCTPVDYLMVSRGSKVPPNLILDYLNPKTILVDKSIPFKNHLLWKKEARSRNIPFMSVWERGAITIKC